jgi:hypothetical protein
MSRTKKDRPYWVRANDKTEAREESHNHLNLGKARYKRIPVLDENDEPIMEERITTYNAFREHKAWREGVTYEEAIADMDKWGWLWKEQEIARYTTVKTVQVVDYVIADHCTINEPCVRSGGHYNFQVPCSHHLAHQKWYPVHKNERKAYNNKQRTYSRNTLKNVIKEINSEGDFFEDLTPDVLIGRREWY